MGPFSLLNARDEGLSPVSGPLIDVKLGHLVIKVPAGSEEGKNSFIL